MTQTKCLNVTLCNQFINTNINDSYCKDCLFYFNYTLKFLYNNIEDLDMDRPTCPICLSDNEILYIKQKNCNHYTCLKCIYNIYFGNDYLNKMPINPVLRLKKSWNLFIYNQKNIIIKNKFTNPLTFSLYDFDYELFDELVKKYKYIIPSIFKRNFEELIKFQIKKNQYILDYKKLQSAKIKVINKCPFCRNANLNTIDI